MSIQRFFSSLFLSILLCSPVYAGVEPEQEMTLSEVKGGTLLFGKEGKVYQVAPGVRAEVEIKVTGMIARVTLHQTFMNPSNDWIEGIYVFPLPENAAVDELKMVLEDRIIEGEIKEREEAKRIYTKAKKAGKKASLVEQERPNLFTASVANIPPGGEIAVIIHYQQDIHYDQGRFDLTFPMTLTPRFIPGVESVQGFAGTGWGTNTDEVPDAQRITPPVALPTGDALINPVSITVELDAGFPLREVKSPSHKLDTVDDGETRVRLALAEGTVSADRDFVLEWEPKVGQAPAAALFTEEHKGNTYALLMVMPPAPNALNSKAEIARLPRETIFVIDTSGSMSGNSIQQARKALLFGLDRLEAGDRFNVIEFNSSTSQLFSKSQAVNPETLRKAKSFVRGLDANGGTQIMRALEAVFSHAEDEVLVSQVLFITDGSVGNEAALFAYIQKNLGMRRLFTVGIGSAPNSHFMTKAAQFGRGTFTYIHTPQEVSQKMGDLLRKLESPVLSHIDVKWPSKKVESWPGRVPDLYLGEPIVIAAKLNKLGGEVHITGKRGSQSWDTKFDVQGGSSQLGIHKLWARKKIGALMDGLVSGEDAKDVRKSVVKLGLGHHLVTKYTSLVAVEKKRSRPKDEDLQKKSIPNAIPKGNTMFGNMPQTATPAPLYVVMSLFCFSAAVWLAARSRLMEG